VLGVDVRGSRLVQLGPVLLQRGGLLVPEGP
jgi:hypothetical protein